MDRLARAGNLSSRLIRGSDGISGNGWDRMKGGSDWRQHLGTIHIPFTPDLDLSRENLSSSKNNANCAAPSSKRRRIELLFHFSPINEK